MPITIQCPNPDCQQKYILKEGSLGGQARCKKCGMDFTLEMKADETGGLMPRTSCLPASKRPTPADAAQSAAASPTPSRPATRSAQKKVGPYSVLRRLGGGAMGEVWLAYDPSLDRQVAIKTLRPEVALGPQGLDRFLREARLAAKLHHTNAVTVYQVGAEGKTAYIAMEYVEGQSLDKAISPGKPMNWRDATRAVRDAAAGLAAAHKLGLIHRDIKPANLMRTTEGLTKVVDFGLARAQKAQTQLTQQGALLGTPAYLAPELWQRQEADARSDVYALACTYYCLLTGESPFDGDSFVALGYQHTHEPLPDPREQGWRLPDAACRILSKGTQKDPAARYQSAAEMQAGLDILLLTPQEALIFGTKWVELQLTAAAAGTAATQREALSNAQTLAIPDARPVRGGIDRGRMPGKWLVGAGLAVAAAVLLGIVFSFQSGKGTAKKEEISQVTPQPTPTPTPTLPPTPLPPPPSDRKPPRLAKIPDQTVDEGNSFQFDVALLDRGSANALHFSLAPDAPFAAAIERRTGRFTWMPSTQRAFRQSQTPGEYPITVQVQADGPGNLEDQATFHVIVRRVAKPPIISFIAPQRLSVGQTHQFTIIAMNSIGTTQNLKFDLLDAPSWVKIAPSSGVVTCTPDTTVSPGKYSLTVRVANDGAEAMPVEKSFVMTVLRPMPVRSPAGDLLTDTNLQRAEFRIELPSHKVLASADLNVLNKVQDETDELVKKCEESRQHTVGFYQTGSKSALEIISGWRWAGNEPSGPAVFFYPTQSGSSPTLKQSVAYRSGSRKRSVTQHSGTPTASVTYHKEMPKQYIMYHNGRWNGLLVTWNKLGQREFWGNYLNGQRDGLCCLFNEDKLIAVIEYTRNSTDALHLIEANQIKNSFMKEDEISKDTAAKTALERTGEIEQRVKKDVQALRDRVKRAVQAELGELNKKKRDSFNKRSSDLGAHNDAANQALMNQATQKGLWH